MGFSFDNMDIREEQGGCTDGQVCNSIGCITVETMRDKIVQQDEKLKKNISNMRELQSLTRTLVAQCPEGEIKAIIEKIADEFRFSDPVSSDSIYDLEENMRSQIGDIQQALVDGDPAAAKEMCSKLMGSLAERNRVCSMSK